MSSTNKQDRIKEFAINSKDTGSADVQIALLTDRITNLTAHLKQHKHDFGAKRGLIIIVGHRRRLLNYVKANSVEKYKDLIKKLGLRS